MLRNTHILRSDAIFKEYFHLVARANLSDEWLGETDYLPQDIGDDLWVSCIDRWEEEGAAGPALAALERRPDIVPRTLKHASRLFADWATAPRASVLSRACSGTWFWSGMKRRMLFSLPMPCWTLRSGLWRQSPSGRGASRRR